MSDLFNTQKKREQALLMFRQAQYKVRSGVKPEDLYPKARELPEDPVGTSSQLAKWLIEHDAQSLNPVMCPEMQIKDIRDMLDSLGVPEDSLTRFALVEGPQEEAEELGEEWDPKILLPLGPPRVIMKYTSARFIRKWDDYLLRNVFWRVLNPDPSQPDFDQGAASQLQLLLRTIHDKVMTNGTLSGQLNRWLATKKIRLGLEGKVKPLSYADFGANLIKAYPQAFPPGVETWAGEIAHPPMSYTPISTSAALNPLTAELTSKMPFFMDFSRAMDALYPLSTLPSDSPGLYYSPLELFDIGETGSEEPTGDDIPADPDYREKVLNGLPVNYRLPRDRTDASAGVPFFNKSKGEVSKEMVIMAEIIYREWEAIIQSVVTGQPSEALDEVYTEILAKHKEDPYQKLLEAFLDKWQYLSVSPVFPKAERYDVSEGMDALLEKTRNIYLFSGVMNILGQIATQKLGELGVNRNFLTPNPTPDDPSGTYNTINMAKWHPFHGNMHTTLKKLIACEPNEPGAFFLYSDNLYYYNPRTKVFYSLDMEKGEANATQEQVQAFYYYLLTRVYVTESGSRRFNTVWATLLMHVMPNFVCDARILLLNQQLQMYGLGSGVPITFFVNHWVNSRLYITIYLYLMTKGVERDGEYIFPELDFSEDQIKHFASVSGVNFKVEKVVYNLPKALDEIGEACQKIHNAYSSPEEMTPEEYPTMPLPIIDLDLLGYGVTYCVETAQYVPVLAPDRLYASLAYPEAKETHDTIQEKVDQPVAQFRFYLTGAARAKALIMVGGWTQPTIAKALAFEADNYLKIAHRIAKTHDINVLSEAHDVGMADPYLSMLGVDKIGEFILDSKVDKRFMMRLWEAKNADSDVDRSLRLTPFANTSTTGALSGAPSLLKTWGNMAQKGLLDRGEIDKYLSNLPVSEVDVDSLLSLNLVNKGVPAVLSMVRDPTVSKTRILEALLQLDVAKKRASTELGLLNKDVKLRGIAPERATPEEVLKWADPRKVTKQKAGKKTTGGFDYLASADGKRPGPVPDISNDLMAKAERLLQEALEERQKRAQAKELAILARIAPKGQAEPSDSEESEEEEDDSPQPEPKPKARAPPQPTVVTFPMDKDTTLSLPLLKGLRPADLKTASAALTTHLLPFLKGHEVDVIKHQIDPKDTVIPGANNEIMMGTTKVPLRKVISFVVQQGDTKKSRQDLREYFQKLPNAAGKEGGSLLALLARDIQSGVSVKREAAQPKTAPPPPPPEGASAKAKAKAKAKDAHGSGSKKGKKKTAEPDSDSDTY